MNQNKIIEKRCSKCFCKIGKGISHKFPCTSKVQHIANLIQNIKIEEKEADHITSSLLKRKIHLADNNGSSNRQIISLSQTHGKPLKVLLKPQDIKKKSLPINWHGASS